MMYKRPHPILIFEGVKTFGLVFLLVLLRGFFTAIDKGLSEWLQSAWIDVATILVIFTLATLRWWLFKYTFDGKIIAIKGGIFFSFDKKIPISKIRCVTCEQSWYYRPFGVTRIRFDSLAKTYKRADISLVLPDDTAQQILASFSKGDEKISSPSFSYIMLLCAFLSDSFAGAGLAAVFVTRLGTILGEQLEKQLVGTIDSILHLIPSGLPPIAKAAAVVIVVGWLIGFFSNLIRHYNLTLTRKKSTLTVTGGAFTKRSSTIKLDSINFINIQQGLFTKLLGIYTVFGHCVGVGKKKEDITTLAPAGNLFTTQKNLYELLPEFRQAPLALRPNKRAFLRFVADPLWLLVPIFLTTALLIAFTSASERMVLSLATFVSIPAVWWLLIRLIDLFTSGIGLNEDSLTLRYSSFLKLNTVLVKRDKIITVKLRQSFFQRIDKRCDVLVYTKGETARRHHIKNVDMAQARKLLRI